MAYHTQVRGERSGETATTTGGLTLAGYDHDEEVNIMSNNVMKRRPTTTVHMKLMININTITNILRAIAHLIRHCYGSTVGIRQSTNKLFTRLLACSRANTKKNENRARLIIAAFSLPHFAPSTSISYVFGVWQQHDAVTFTVGHTSVQGSSFENGLFFSGAVNFFFHPIYCLRPSILSPS